MKFLSISRVYNELRHAWSEKKIYSPASTAALGKELQQAREKKSLSVSEAAKALCFSEKMIIALEKGEEAGISSLLPPGYFRLAVITYARFLQLEMHRLIPLLPPPAPLQSLQTTFIKRLSPLQQKAKKSDTIKKEPFTYSVKELEKFLWKFFKITIAITLVFYIWSLIRHLARALL